MPITISDILKISGIGFYRYEKHVHENNTGYPDYKVIIPSHDIFYPESKRVYYEHIKNISEKPENNNPGELFIMHPVMSGSDYSGALVELSNHDVFKELYGDCAGVFDVYGGYGSFGILISVSWLINPENEEKAREIIDTLNNLSNYPLIDDEHLSNMELEKESECIMDQFTTSDMIREFEKQHGIIPGDGISIDGGLTDDQKWTIYRELSERSNTYPVFEDNGWPYIDWGRIVASYRIGDLTQWDIPHHLPEE